MLLTQGNKANSKLRCARQGQKSQAVTYKMSLKFLDIMGDYKHTRKRKRNCKQLQVSTENTQAYSCK